MKPAMQLGMNKAELNNRFNGVEIRLDGLDSRMDGLDTRMDGLEIRLGGVENRLEGVETGLGEVKTGLCVVENKLDKVDGRLERLETQSATKKDILDLKEELKSYSGVQFEELKHFIQVMAEGLSAQTQKFEQHDKRISTLEDEMPILKLVLKRPL